uniref:Uncharacterized protein n=1 Tax=Anguilla anguilla TaxID=7936 RepID=A0A0E9RTR1_ANGAN
MKLKTQRGTLPSSTASSSTSPSSSSSLSYCWLLFRVCAGSAEAMVTSLRIYL